MENITLGEIANSGWGTNWYKTITIKFTYN